MRKESKQSLNIVEEPSVPYKFEKLEVWKISLELSDIIYKIIEYLPAIENFNLKSQILRATTSISLNIAEGSTYATTAEQKRFVRIAIHSLIEVIAARKLIERRKYITDSSLIQEADEICTRLFKMMISYDKSLN